MHGLLKLWEKQEVKPKFLKVKKVRLLEEIQEYPAFHLPSDKDWEKIVKDPLMDKAIGFLGEEGNRTLVINEVE